MKVYNFECYSKNKSYGSVEAPTKIIIVKGAASKEEAKSVAERNDSSSRIFAGKSFANETKAIESAKWKVDLINRTNKAGQPTVGYVVIDALAQRSIAKLLGM